VVNDLIKFVFDKEEELNKLPSHILP